MSIICGSLSTMDLNPPMHSIRRKMLEPYILQSCTPQALLGRTWGTFFVNPFFFIGRSMSLGFARHSDSANCFE